MAGFEISDASEQTQNGISVRDSKVLEREVAEALHLDSQSPGAEGEIYISKKGMAAQMYLINGKCMFDYDADWFKSNISELSKDEITRLDHILDRDAGDESNKCPANIS